MTKSERRLQSRTSLVLHRANKGNKGEWLTAENAENTEAVLTGLTGFLTGKSRTKLDTPDRSLTRITRICTNGEAKTWLNPEGIASSSPGVARHKLPWVKRVHTGQLNPNGVAPSSGCAPASRHVDEP